MLYLVTINAQLVSLYCGTQFRRLQVDADNRLGIETEESEYKIVAIMRQLRTMLGKSWANAFKVSPSANALHEIIEWCWCDSSLERVYPYFLSSVRVEVVRRVIRNMDDETFQRTALLMADERTPMRFRALVYEIAKTKLLEQGILEHLEYWSKYRLCEFDFSDDNFRELNKSMKKRHGMDLD